MLSHFFRKSFQTIDQNILGINARNKAIIYTQNDIQDYHLADDKIKTKEILDQYDIPNADLYGCAHQLAELIPLWEKVKKYDQMAIKPACGSGGGGIWVIKKQNNVWCKNGQSITEEMIITHMANILMGIFSLNDTDAVLVEKLIVSHKFFTKIYASGVPDIRIILLRDQLLMAMLRMPTKESDGKANLHMGGIGVGIDVESGELKEVFDGRQYRTNHPDSKHQISGLTIPYWEQIKSIALDTSKAFPLNYLGIDIVLDQYAGPYVLEINVRPGLAIQIVNKAGLKDKIESLNLIKF